MNGTCALSKPSLASSGRPTRCPGLRRRCTAHYKRTSSTWADDTFLTVSWCKSSPRPEMMESPKNCGTLVRSYVAWLEYTDTHTAVRKWLVFFSFGILMCPSGRVLSTQSHIYKQEIWNSRWNSPWNTTVIISSLKHLMILLSDKLRWGIRGQRV